MKIEEYLPTIQKNIFLENYTTFKIGGPAQYFLEVKTKEDLIKAILVAKKMSLPFFVLGGGSNLLVSDKGYKGLVIKCQMSNVKCQNQNPKLKTIYAESGIRLSELVKLSLEKSLTGLEWAAGIPGTFGGAIRGNAGAFSSSMADVVKTVEVLDIRDFKNPNSKIRWTQRGLPGGLHLNKIQNPKSKTFKNYDCKFDCRESIFKENPNLIILSSIFQLKKGKKKEIRKKMEEYLNYRMKTQPLNFPSAGSIFINPKGQSAGELIEKCSLKGKRIGNVKISEKHANFIVNLGKGKAKDVVKLINLIKKKVKNKFGILLEEEIQYLF